MKIMYLGIAVWPSWEIAQRKQWIWQKSIERFGYDFKYYGVGTQQFPGYRAQKIETQLRYLKKEGYGDATHIFYTDCCDCLMLAPPAEIELKYKTMGAPPMLVSGASQLGNVSDGRYPWFDEARPGVKYRYPCVGGYLMEAPLMVEWLQRMHDEYPPDDPRWGDDCFVWYEGFQQGWWRPEIDTECQIWQVGEWQDSEIVTVDEETDCLGDNGLLRLRNKTTGSFSCLWHNSGGSADQDTFKDAAMIGPARQLGILGPDEVRP